MLNLILAGVIAQILRIVYVRFGRALSNRREMSNNFLMVTMTTMMIISVVRSSLALSLGLVGALSIVRFRTAIKEPEELAFLFLAIAVGLGLGAEQTRLTLAGFSLICLIFVVARWRDSKTLAPNLFVTVSGKSKQRLDAVLPALEKSCRTIDLRRLDESAERFEASFRVEIDSLASVSKLKTDLAAVDPTFELTFLENRGIL